MDQALRRVVITLISLSALVACSSDPKMMAHPLDTDAGDEDAASPSKPTKSDAATSGGDSGAKDAGQDSGSTMVAMQSCGSLMCKSPATCEESGGKSKCVCPSGYNDTKGDGSQCDDKDECAKASDSNCGKNAKCVNKPGSFECTCPAPAYKGDGKTCTCADGYVEKEGLCLAKDGGKCSDNLDCEHSHCQSGICCATACAMPPMECTTTEGATCEDGKTCKYPVSKDGAACDDGDACTTGSMCNGGKCITGTGSVSCDDKNLCTDDSCDKIIGCKNANNTATCDDSNPCTLNDRCTGGACGSTMLKDCTSANDACNKGECDPANGNCKKAPLADGGSCNDSNSCSVGDVCKGGTCAGPDSACGPNANGCTQGSPNRCMCAAQFVDKNGQCAPMNDECVNQNPCSSDANCLDLSNTNDPNQVRCTCKPGFGGDGKTCYTLEPCKNNPCGEGRGTCTAGELGKYTCACAAGFVQVGGQCVCNMGGTFASRVEVDLAWTAEATIEGGSDTSYAWSIERHNYDAQGNLDIEIIPCGESNVDLCGNGVGLLMIPPEAYAQYVPANVWGSAGLQPGMLHMSLPNAIPNADYKSPQLAALQGIRLTDPMGPWPGSRKDIQGGPEFDGSAVNGATWVDVDGDGFIGLTTYTVGPNGAAADGSATAPVEAYGKNSKVCPRGNANAARSPYNYPPALENGATLRRIKRFSSANRSISALDGKINSCDLITGSIVGPNDGKVRYDVRVGACVRVNGDNESACSTSILDFLDTDTETQDQSAGKFILKRVSNANITCADVRKMNFN